MVFFTGKQSIIERKIEEKILDIIDIFLNKEKLMILKKTDDHTLLDRKRRRKIISILNEINKDSVNGDFVELGVYKGGVSAILAIKAIESDFNRKIWLYDSFCGLPEPSCEDGGKAIHYSDGLCSGKLRTIGKLKANIEEVKNLLFFDFKIDPKIVEIVPGWIQETLEKRIPKSISFLHLDLDWYQSTKFALEYLYDRVTPNGWIVIDDYGFWNGAKKAFDDFMVERELKVILKRNGYTQAYFKKNIEDLYI